MTDRMPHSFWLACALALGACSAAPEKGTLAALKRIEPDLSDVTIDDSLERAEQSYRRYLEERPSRTMAPEAMRRMADLQIEKEFGIMGSGELIEQAVEEDAGALASSLATMAPKEDAEFSPDRDRTLSGLDKEIAEDLEEFERRATAATDIAATSVNSSLTLPEMAADSQLSGPLGAIKTYQKILNEFPDYERNDQVLYQMSRAYDELGQPDEAIQVIDRLIKEYPGSKFSDEVYFRRGEYYFVRKKYLDAEESYLSVIAIGPASPFYELALYKSGWTFYKQDMYEEALDSYMAMLDYRLSQGFNFDEVQGQEDEHRVADTFRAISLSFSNLGGPEVIDDYFAANGHRTYGDLIYSNLGEFFLEKLRYQDAAAVYSSFVDLNPSHRIAPHFSMRIIEIYEKGEFPQLVVESKKNFSLRYAIQADYWRHYDISAAADVMAFLKTNLTDLATHFHALYQDEELVEEQVANYAEALQWYGQFLNSFPNDPDSPPINYRLADLLLEHQDFSSAALEYERTAYNYPRYEKSAAAGYAAIYAHRKHLENAPGATRPEIRLATVESSIRFVENFPEHEEAPPVLGAAADDLYAMKDFDRAIQTGTQLIEQYPESDRALRRSAWIVVAHSSIDTAKFAEAEHGYSMVLSLTPGDDESRPAIIDSLAASIYKQGEQATIVEDYRAAAGHFLRIRATVPSSTITASATYDGAAALVKLDEWVAAAEVFEVFRNAYPDNDLANDATKQLALIYKQDGQTERSAAEHVRIADESTDPQLSREALLVAAELYEDAGNTAQALTVFERYVEEYPSPVDIALETRTRMAEIYQQNSQLTRYHQELRRIVDIDARAGEERSERTRYLASRSALVLAELQYQRFASLQLAQPFEESLARKQALMDKTMSAFERLVDYEVGEVTAAATYYIAEIYFNFSQTLLDSERPTDLSDAELAAYDLVLEEEAYPFEEQSIAVHEENFELLRAGLYNPWIQKSLGKLAEVMPGRYAKAEISNGFLGAIDFYVYRMPVVPELLPGESLPADEPDVRPEKVAVPSGSAQVSENSTSD